MLRETLKCLGLLTCSVLLVLLVPSSAWSDDTESPLPSPSSSPSDGSSSPSPTEPTPDPTPESEPATSEPAEPTPSEGETTPPPPTETVTVQADPIEQPLSCTPEAPCVVEPSSGFVSFLTLTSGVALLSLLGLLVRSFGR